MTRMMPIRGALAASMLLGAAIFPTGWSSALGADAGPFAKFAGRWVGEGRLGIRDAATEQVKCRVTYTPGDGGNTLHQSVRCASAGGNIEVQTDVRHAAGTLTGTWKELTRDMGGSISGKVTEKGLRLRIASEGFNANMQVELKGERQVIEIQFIDSALVGLTLWLTQG